MSDQREMNTMTGLSWTQSIRLHDQQTIEAKTGNICGVKKNVYFSMNLEIEMQVWDYYLDLTPPPPPLFAPLDFPVNFPLPPFRLK